MRLSRFTASSLLMCMNMRSRVYSVGYCASDPFLECRVLRRRSLCGVFTTWTIVHGTLYWPPCLWKPSFVFLGRFKRLLTHFCRFRVSELLNLVSRWASSAIIWAVGVGAGGRECEWKGLAAGRELKSQLYPRIRKHKVAIACFQFETLGLRLMLQAL